MIGKVKKIYLTSILEEELREMLKGFFKSEPYRARQVFDWIYKKDSEDFSSMVNLPHILRKGLSEKFLISSLSIDNKKFSKDGTRKYLFRLEDGEFIEAVSIPAKDRLTVCLSTQVGCRFGCRFCASTKGGFIRNLRTEELIEQTLKIKKDTSDKRITNIVFMGIGEPLDNYENTIKAIRILNSYAALNIGARKFTVSTCGIIPGIERLSKENLQVELAVSLHSSEDKVRSELMPENKKFPLSILIDVCRRFISETGRQVTFEYIMIEGMNDRRVDIANLVRLLKGLNCKVNLIPLNPIPEFKFNPTPLKKIYDFCAALNKQGVKTTLRHSKGRDIDASCGQLRQASKSIK